MLAKNCWALSYTYLVLKRRSAQTSKTLNDIEHDLRDGGGLASEGALPLGVSSIVLGHLNFAAGIGLKPGTTGIKKTLNALTTLIATSLFKSNSLILSPTGRCNFPEWSGLETKISTW